MTSAVHLNVSAWFYLSDFDGWADDQIAAFLGGIAQLVVAESKPDQVGEPG